MRIDLMQLQFVDPKLRHIAIEAERHFGVELTITSLYRIDDGGVHGTLPLRGLDVRCHDRTVGGAVEDYANTMWVYDPGRPHLRVCQAHDSGMGFHLHFQVHPKTIRRL